MVNLMTTRLTFTINGGKIEIPNIFQLGIEKRLTWQIQYLSHVRTSLITNQLKDCSISVRNNALKVPRRMLIILKVT